MERNTKVIVYYLPQFHEVEENSRWWGEGFTDWTSVREARQLYAGHKQPRMPYRGRYYCLLDKNTMAWQSELSKKAGVDGFCFYHYWFHGKKILERPVENYLKWKDLKQHYCLAWANDSWVRSWSGIDGNDWCPLHDRKYGRDGKEILLEQDYGGEETWAEHFEDLLPYFKDKRYLRCEGKPVFLICRGELITDLRQMLELWQKLARKNGLPGLYIILSNCTRKLLRQSKADGMVMYEPGYTLVNDLKVWCALIKRISGGLLRCDYGLFWRSVIRRRIRNPHIYQGGFVNYDDTPRRGNQGLCMDGYSNEKFSRYLGRLLKKSRRRGSRFLFLTAWNEWGEGAYLEPDTINGYEYLKAVRKAVKRSLIGTPLSYRYGYLKAVRKARGQEQRIEERRAKTDASQRGRKKKKH